MNIIEIDKLNKSFGKVHAVNDVSFNVESGSMFAFLGINGAGKSTTINIISTLLNKDSGKVIVNGFDLDKQADKIRSSIGMVFQGSILDKTLTVKDNLKIRASYYGLHGSSQKQRLNELSETFELQEILGRPYGKLSGGQRRRVDIARALIHRPQILILDEPTTGLDPQTRKSVWQIINNVRKETGMTVFLTTHYMEEAVPADMVVIIDNGKIVAHDTPINLKNKYSSDYVKIYMQKSAEFEEKLSSYKFTYQDNLYRISVKSSKEALEFIAKYSQILQDFEVVKGDMDDVFLQVTGKSLKE